MSAETGQPLQVEAQGETVGEAKWTALRELERLAPGLDKTAVRFQILSEGERGLLGVGYAPARVVAVVDEAPPEAPAAPDTPHAAQARELVERVAEALGVECRVQVEQDEDVVHVRCSGRELGVLIGRHGQTIDAIQYLANAIAYRTFPDDRKEVVVDAAGYRERRRATLEALAVRSAERALRSGEPVELEPMSAVERKVVHLRLKSFAGVETTSEGAEPNRFVVVSPVDA
ncbi:MAG TPA: RNA-binding cell elongation regulator Jag/EloR [Gaiellaceae bacterium]|nr:RNA-binding cell elongation regulator Jag/EloR [Gaiellaceae bacterium]